MKSELYILRLDTSVHHKTERLEPSPDVFTSVVYCYTYNDTHKLKTLSWQHQASLIEHSARLLGLQTDRAVLPSDKAKGATWAGSGFGRLAGYPAERHATRGGRVLLPSSDRRISATSINRSAARILGARHSMAVADMRGAGGRRALITRW
jgi:hypothetical protein